jgi:serine/threonine protein kinase
MDLFTEKDIELNANEGFWQIKSIHKQINQPFLFGGNLLKANSQGVMSSTYYMLTCNYLISCKGPTKSLNKRSNINWKRLQPVTKEDPPTVYRGFKLSTQTCSETFYAESLQEYDVWLLYLTKLCLLESLEEDYEMLSELGRGSSAVVMKAFDKTTQEYVAIKLVNITSKGADACLKEVSLMRRLSHESILQVLKVYSTAEMIAIVLEYVEGGTMFEFIQRAKRVTEVDARVLMIKLLGGLEYCHSQLCVHRDLKLENILLARQGDLSSIKIADFGLAADLESEQLGKRCGSAGYVAPEILLDRSQTEKVDVFSAGVILYMCLSGLAPFGGADERAMLRSNAACSVNLESAYWAHISSQGKDLVRRMMMKEPLKRLSSREAFSHAWLTKLQKLPPKPPKIELQESLIAESPKVTSRVMKETITQRMEETKITYLNLLAGREASVESQDSDPCSPCSPWSPLTPSADELRRKPSANPTSPAAYIRPEHSRLKPTFGELSAQVSGGTANLKGSISPGGANVKMRTLKFMQKRTNYLDVNR